MTLYVPPAGGLQADLLSSRNGSRKSRLHLDECNGPCRDPRKLLTVRTCNENPRRTPNPATTREKDRRTLRRADCEVRGAVRGSTASDAAPARRVSHH